MVERVDIEVTDKVATSVATKLKDIAAQADKADKSIVSLKTNLSGLNPSALSRLATANAQAATAALRNQQASQASAKAILQQQAAAVSLQSAQTRLVIANNSVAISQQKVTAQTANTAKAQINAAKASVQLQQAQQRLQQQQAKTQGGNAGAGVIAGVSTGLAARTVLQTIDSYQLLENKIRSVTNSEEDRVRIQEELLKIGNETFQTTEAVATLYQRLSTATKGLGVDEQGLYSIITNVSKAFALSGATAAESQGAIIQLTQAIGNNFKSSSQELNTILEQAPIVADVFAKELGKTRGELKQLAKAGELTSKDFVKAFGDSGKGIAELNLRFGQLIPAISQAGNAFKNNFQSAVGQLAEVTGAAGGLVHGIQFLSDHMEVVIGVGTTLFPLLLAGFATSTLASNVFNASLLRNPLLLGFALFAGVLAGLTALALKTEFGRKVLNELGNTFSSVLINATKGLGQVAQGLGIIWDGIRVIKNGFSNEGLIPSDWGVPIINAAIAMEDARKSSSGLGDALREMGGNASAAGSDAGFLSDQEDKLKKSSDDVTAAAIRQKAAFAAQHDQIWANIEAYGQLIEKMNAATAAQTAWDSSLLSGQLRRSQYGYSGTGYNSDLDWRAHLRRWGLEGSIPNGYAGGGYTGDGGKFQPKGIVHGGEYVINKEQTAKHINLLEAINGRAPGYAAGGYVGSDYGTHTDVNKTYSVQELHLPTHEITEQALKWQSDLAGWWATTKASIKPKSNVAQIQGFIGQWLADLPRYAIEPTHYRFEDLLAAIGKVGWAAPILAQAPIWGETLGKFVNYAGPSYGGSVMYGGDANDPINYSLPAAVDPNSITPKTTGLQMTFAGLDPNYHLPDWNKIFDVGGFAEGGSFTVPGYGGTDSKRIQMMATPGEVVSVTPKGQASGANIKIDMNISTPDAQSFRRSRNQVLGELTRELAAYQGRN